MSHLITYESRTGKVWIDGVLQTEKAYSGKGAGLNNPDMEGVAKTGPIPRGEWRITGWTAKHPTLGIWVAYLLPIKVPGLGNRAAFRIHGDNKKKNFSASEGCIIMPPKLREAVRLSGATLLKVI